MNSLKAKQALVFVVAQDERDLFRTPRSHRADVPGIALPLELLEDEAQFTKQLAEVCGLPQLASYINIETGFPLRDADESGYAVAVLARIPKQYYQADQTWVTLPECMRQLPANGSRLAVLKMLQWLAGTHLDTLEAHHMDESLLKKLTKHDGDLKS